MNGGIIGRCSVSLVSKNTSNKGMNRTRNHQVFHREFATNGGLCAPVIPGVGLLS
jgi:hypothetical protein